jgi:hypothetical protein
MSPVSDPAAAHAAAVVALGHHFGCLAFEDAGPCDCGTVERAGGLVSAVVVALGWDAVADGDVRLVLDMRVADARELLQDVKWLNDSEARAATRGGVERRKRPWRAIAREAAAEAIANSVATHHFSHAPESLFALGPWAHEYSTKEAAVVLGCTVQNVRWLCSHKVIPARQAPGGRRGWTLDGEAVHAFAAARGRAAGADVPPAARPRLAGELT